MTRIEVYVTLFGLLILLGLVITLQVFTIKDAKTDEIRALQVCNTIGTDLNYYSTKYPQIAHCSDGTTFDIRRKGGLQNVDNVKQNGVK